MVISQDFDCNYSHDEHQAQVGQVRGCTPGRHPVISRSILPLMLSLCLSGCHGRPKTIPNHVSSDELAVYQAWLQESLLHSDPPRKMWYVETETWPYSEESSCDKELLKDGVKASYIQALRDLGTARYLIPPFNIDFARTFDPYRSTVDLKTPDGPFITRYFSRVAFSSDGREAFLHVAGVKGPGIAQGGHGQDLLATQDGTGWHFRRVGCVEIID